MISILCLYTHPSSVIQQAFIKYVLSARRLLQKEVVKKKVKKVPAFRALTVQVLYCTEVLMILSVKLPVFHIRLYCLFLEHCDTEQQPLFKEGMMKFHLEFVLVTDLVSTALKRNTIQQRLGGKNKSRSFDCGPVEIVEDSRSYFTRNLKLGNNL